MLTVITIIMLVMALALPNFLQMMNDRKWSAAVGNLQGMIMRARALATNARTTSSSYQYYADFSVEFDIEDDGTKMWLESESNDMERIPDLWVLQHELGGGAAIRYFLNTFRNSGGSYSNTLITELRCGFCNYEWTGGGSSTPCPRCGKGGNWKYNHVVGSYYTNIAYNPAGASTSSYNDNARQSDYVPLYGTEITISVPRSRHFINWDSRTAVECYGYDDTPDIRVGVNGALVQTYDPVICLRQSGTENVKAIQVVRCTGRVIPARVP